MGNKVTACLYFNDAWISLLPEFVDRWQGPISVVYEAVESKSSEAREKLVGRLEALRASNALIRSFVDFHIAYQPQFSQLQYNRTRERLIVRPIGTNFHLNLARFFARTEMIWLVSDARMLPSAGLRQKLDESEAVRGLVLDQADAIVIPLFGAFRKKYAGENGSPHLMAVREELGLNLDGDGVGANEFERLAAAYTSNHHNSLPFPIKDWPRDMRTLAIAALSSPYPRGADGLDENSGPHFAMYDRSWENGKGPTNFERWSKAFRHMDANKAVVSDTTNIPHAQSTFYQVMEYDLHYSPSMVIGKDRQPWCTERFEFNRAVCTYQMYLQGAKMWVMPNEWAYTLESIEKGEKEPKNEADRLKVGRRNESLHREWLKVLLLGINFIETVHQIPFGSLYALWPRLPGYGSLGDRAGAARTIFVWQGP